MYLPENRSARAVTKVANQVCHTFLKFTELLDKTRE
jgi:hypothetical protein